MEDTMPRLTELVTRASWRLRRGTAKELEPIGITYAQARVLRIVADAPEPLRMADLADRLDVVPRSATSMIDALESAGLVARRPDASDRRSIRLTVTAAGSALLDRMRALRVEKAEELFGKLTAAEQHELARMLERVLDEPLSSAGNGGGKPEGKQALR
jgi:DNA-binding MarR family transcriptional regulator